MYSIPLTIPSRKAFQGLVSQGAGMLSNVFRARTTRRTNLPATLNNQQRTDLGDDNALQKQVTQFQEYELDLWIAKQCPDALQFYLVRGPER